MKGITLTESGHFVHVYPSADPAGTVTGDWFSLENYAHATIVVAKGSGSGATVTLENATGAGGTSNATMPFNYALESTAAGDTLGSLTAAGTGGIGISANSGVLVVIEVDASELPDGSPWLTPKMTSVGASQVCIIACLTGSRWGKSESMTAIV